MLRAGSVRASPILAGARWALALALALALAAVGCGSGSSATPGAPSSGGQRPNFVVIIADDLAAGLFGAGRHLSFVDYPNLERLAARGVQFDRAFVTTSLCSPSRASLLSGLYAHTHGVRTNQSGDIPAGTETFPLLLQRTGYKTAFVGKWHMDGSTDGPRPGFDYWVSFRGQGVYEDPVLNENGHTVKRTGYITDILTEYGVQWLRGRGNEPFLLVLSHKAVHDPFLPAPRHRGAFPDASLPMPGSFGDSFLAKPPWQRRYVLCGGTAADVARCPEPPPALPVWPWPAHEPWRIDYFRTLLALDDSVGAVVGALEAQGLTGSTHVVFMGDNGMLLGEHRLGDKRLMYEESIRVPLVIAGGSQTSPRRSSAMVLNIDLAPTILQLAGAAVPGRMQGLSLTGILRGQADSVRSSFLYEYFSDTLIPGVPGILGIRTERFTYATYPQRPDEGEELYDLEQDPNELQNLAALAERAALKANLRDQLDRLLVATGSGGL